MSPLREMLPLIAQAARPGTAAEGISISGLVSMLPARLARRQSEGGSKVPAQSPRFAALAAVSAGT